jgi:uncharacterized protein (TIGR02246 family)
MPKFALLAVLFAITARSGFSQTLTSADESSIRQRIAAYAKAMSAADGSAMAQFYTEDGDIWDSAAQKMVKGRVEIAREYDQLVRSERQITIDTTSFLDPEIALLDAQYYSRSRAHVSYIMVKKDGQWFIRSSRVTVLGNSTGILLITALLVGALAGIGLSVGFKRFSRRSKVAVA